MANLGGTYTLYKASVPNSTGSGGTVTYSSNSMTDSSKSWTSNQWVGAVINSGGVGGHVISNTNQTVTIDWTWSGNTPSAAAAYTLLMPINSGTSTGSNTSNTINDTGVTTGGAGWQTSPTLAGFSVRIKSGTGANQVRRITTNSSTQLTVTPNWTTIPDSTSVYEIVLIWYSGDHLTSAITGYFVNMELDSSSGPGTINIDGNYGISILAGGYFNFNNTFANLMTFGPNLRATQGQLTFWPGFIMSGGSYPQFGNVTVQGVLFQDTNTPVSCNSRDSLETLVWNNCIFENCYRGVLPTPTIMPCNATKKFTNLLGWKGPYAMNPAFPGITSSARWQYENCWFENGQYGSFEWQTNGPDIQHANDCVFINCGMAGATNRSMASGKKVILRDNYSKQYQGGSAFVGNSSTTHDGAYLLYDNVMANVIANSAGSGSHGTLDSAYNDYGGICNITSNTRALVGTALANYSVAKSRWDMMTGLNNAAYTNTDATTGQNSGATPSMYNFLVTGRTTPRSAGVPNKPYLIDNIVIAAGPSDQDISFTFDCANGATAGAGSSTTSGAATAGTNTLPMLELTGYLPEDWIEVNYPNATSEFIQLSSSYAETTGAGNLTTATNLVNSYSSGVTVKRRQRHRGLPFIRLGIVSGNYFKETDLPPPNEWPELYVGKNTTYKGQTFTFKRTGHAVTISKLYPSTVYYYQCCVQMPLGEILVSSEGTFSTNAISGLNYPTQDNVVLGVQYGPSNIYTGDNRQAIASHVESGYVYGPSDSVTGTLSTPTAAQNADAVWNALISTHTVAGSFGAFIQNILNLIYWLGL